MTARLQTITSFSNPTIKAIRGLELKKNRDEGGIFVAEGLRHVREAAVCGWQVDKIVFHGHDRMREQILALQTELPEAAFIETTPEILQKITHRENAETVIAVIRQQWAALSDVRDGLWIVLEEIRDPGNLGTIIRTADAVAAQGIVLVGACCDPFSSESVRASMGSFARLRYVRTALPAFLSWRGGWPGQVIGTHLQGAQDFRSVDYRTPLLLVMGNEQKGMSSEMAAACTTCVRMPMKGGADSLNVAVATGVMLYEITRLS